MKPKVIIAAVGIFIAGILFGIGIDRLYVGSPVDQMLFRQASAPPPTPSGERLVVYTPQPRTIVSSPIMITGKARNIFFEGGFRVELRAYDYPLGHPQYAESSRVLASTGAWAVDNCDPVGEQWCNFEAKLNYSNSNLGVEHILYFYDGGEGDPGTPAAPKFISALPIVIVNN